MQHEGAGNWIARRIGGGEVIGDAAALRLSFAAATGQRYTNAQVDDYAAPRSACFAWRPPVRLRLRARASHPAALMAGTVAGTTLLGTAGFGFWNAPFAQAGIPSRLPDAVWFLYASPPAQMCLVPDMPGYGWKAQVVHANRPGALAAALPTLGAVAWARLTGDQRAAVRWVQRLSGAREAILHIDLAAWHEYRLDWQSEAAIFFVDEQEVLRVLRPPRGPLGFVAWIDNQYAVATPRGELRSGILPTGAQSLELADCSLTAIVD